MRYIKKNSEYELSLILGIAKLLLVYLVTSIVCFVRSALDYRFANF